MATRGSPFRRNASVTGTLLWPEVPVLHLRHCIFTAVFALASLCGCTKDAVPVAQSATDDFGETFAVGAPTPRIVSLNPTTTELLFALGAGDRLVGRTTYDHYPDEARKVADLGPGLRPNVEAILATHPSLVLLYASEDNRDAARRLRAAGIATAAFRVDRISDFERVTLILARLIGDSAKGVATVDSVRKTLEHVRTASAALKHPKVFWPLWDAPLLTVGHGSYLNELITIAGGENVFDDLLPPSPSVTFEELLHRDPDFVLVGPTSRARILADPRWQTLRAVREGHVLVVDTTIMIGPSVRVGSSAVSLARLLHPDGRY
ncbi:MAG: ABC-type transporter, periplasmic subunit [Gemmatimonadetes bacterium]|nr:ABC-type transporter, periplasmic subunit [Gemmatimonadota bacterium]